MRSLLIKIAPLLILCLGLLAFIAGLIIFAYLLMFGALIGVAMFIVTWVRNRFFPKQPQQPVREGRTFEHKEL